LSPEPASAPFGSRGLFAGALLGLGFAAVFALERVGAPDALVVALGPLLGLVGLVAIGAVTRARTLLDFLAARRAAPAAFAGLALAATVGGFALGFAATDESGEAPWRGFALGVAVAALFVAPRWRQAQASAMADVFATRFPAPFARARRSLVLVASGLSLAAAGLGFAALTLEAALRITHVAALALGAATLFLSLAPGGLMSLIWCDAATAAAGLLILALLAALSFDGDFERIVQTWGAFAQGAQAPLVAEVAAGCAAAAMFAFCQPAFAVASPGAARRAGVAALVWLTLGGLAAAALGGLGLMRPSHAGLASLLACLPALSLARAGLYAASRAAGFDVRRTDNRLWVLASRRMAGVRAAIAFGAMAAAALAQASPRPTAPFLLGLSVWLAFGAPSAVLAMLPGRRSAPAIAALATSVAAASLGRVLGFGSAASELLVGALGAGAAGLAAGLGVYTMISDESAAPVADPFVDLPGEPSV
jgi:hypothetical protein